MILSISVSSFLLFFWAMTFDRQMLKEQIKTILVDIKRGCVAGIHLILNISVFFPVPFCVRSFACILVRMTIIDNARMLDQSRGLGRRHDGHRRIGRGVVEQTRPIRSRCYIESSKNSEKITTNLKKIQTLIFMYHMFKTYYLAH